MMSQHKRSPKRRKRRTRPQKREEDINVKLEDARKTVEELEKEIQELREKGEKQIEFTFKVGAVLSECVKELAGMDELMETIVNKDDPSLEKFISAASNILHHLKEKNFMITNEREERFLLGIAEALDNLSLTEKGCEFLMDDKCIYFRDLVLDMLQVDLAEMYLSEDPEPTEAPEEEKLHDMEEVEGKKHDEDEEEYEEIEDDEDLDTDEEQEALEKSKKEKEEAALAEVEEEEDMLVVKKPLGERVLVPLLDMMANLLETDDGQFIYTGETVIYKMIKANLLKEVSEERKKTAMRILEALSYQLEGEDVAIDLLEILNVDDVKVHLTSTDSEVKMFAQTVMDNITDAVVNFNIKVPGIEITQPEEEKDITDKEN